MGAAGADAVRRRRSPVTGSTNQTEDFALYSPSRFGQLGRPVYKPEHWDKVSSSTCGPTRTIR